MTACVLRRPACPGAPDTRFRLQTIATAMLFACKRAPASPVLRQPSAISCNIRVNPVSELRAAIDIGSNTFRLLIAAPAAAEQSIPWKTVYYTHRIIRLGEGLHHTGRLSGTGMARAIKALKEFSRIISDHGIRPEYTFAVATAAMREASNGEMFRRRIRREAGLDIRVVHGDAEAALSLAGAMAVLHPDVRKDMLLFDIGGASTEFIRARESRMLDAESRKLGVVRLVEAFLKSDPPGTTDYVGMVHESLAHLSEVEHRWQDGRIPSHLVGTAGTVTTLAAIHLDLVPYDVKRINNHVISKAAFFALRDRLLELTHDQRQAIRTIETGRADLMVAGLAMIEAILERWRHRQLIVVDAGLLEGAWLQGRLNQLPK